MLLADEGVLGVAELQTTTEQPVTTDKPKRKKYNLEEKKITTSITNWLKTLDGCWFFKKSGGMTRLANGKYLRSQQSGLPDLCVVYQGRTVWFEVKKPSNTTQTNQNEQIARMQTAGATVAVVRSLDEVKAILVGGAV